MAQSPRQAGGVDPNAGGPPLPTAASLNAQAEAAKRRAETEGPNARNTGRSSGRTVVIACKLPNGIVLHIDRAVTSVNEDTGRSVTKYVHDPETEIRLKGANDSKVIGGYGITTGVDADLWDEWVKQNSDPNGKPLFKPFAMGAIFAVSAEKDAEVEAKSRAPIRTGLEPIDPNRAGRGIEPVPNTAR